MKLIIQKNIGPSLHDEVKIFALEDGNKVTPRTTFSYDSNAKKIIGTVRSESNENQIIEPLIQMPNDFFDDFVTCILEYVVEKNIKLESQSFLEGKLLATEKHLEDMREFFKKKIEL